MSGRTIKSWVATTPEERRVAITSSLAELITVLTAAWVERDWEHFGFDSWRDYLGSLNEGRPVLATGDREQRIAIHTQLRRVGMSTRAIGPVTGVDHSTVVRDGGANAPPKTRRQEIKEMAPDEREVCPYCGQDLPDRLQIAPSRRRKES